MHPLFSVFPVSPSFSVYPREIKKKKNNWKITFSFEIVNRARLRLQNKATIESETFLLKIASKMFEYPFATVLH